MFKNLVHPNIDFKKLEMIRMWLIKLQVLPSTD